MAEATPLYLMRLEIPQVPLITGTDNTRDIYTLTSYLQSLEAYFYNLNAAINTDTLILTAIERVESVAVTFFPAGNIQWVNGASTVGYIFFRIPESYISGDLTITVGRRGAAAGTAVMTWLAYRFRNSTALFAAVVSTAINFTPGDVNTHYINLTVPAATFTNGDTIRVDITRDAVDTMTAPVAIDGSTISYSAYKGIP